MSPRGDLLVVADGMYLPEAVAGPCGLVVEGGSVRSILRDLDPRRLPTDTPVLDLRPWRLAPGSLDLHTHGFAGYDVTTGSEADMRAMAMALPATGVTAFVPTIASTGPSQTLQQVQRIASAMRAPSPTAAEILGVRLEGPFISRTRKGAQAEQAIRPPDPRELASLAEHAPIRIVDFAPEEAGGRELLAALVERGIVPSIGHTAATCEQAVSAIDAGARHCTHLFNAMPSFEHRSPGVVGALLTTTRASVEVIADGIHVHPLTLKLVVQARGPHATALVTDAMSAAGLADGEYAFLGRQVRVAEGAVRLPDGTLAGSILTLDRAVRNMVTLAGVSWSDAIRMATLTPATIVGAADRKGALSPGANADFVVLDTHGAVRQTWRGGQLAFDAGTREGPAPVRGHDSGDHPGSQ